MGTYAITTSGFPIDRNLVSEYLGFDEPVENSYRATVTNNMLFFPSVSVQSIMLLLTRIIADISHKASTEVAMLDFPDDIVQISSIMPQKKNPVILEHVRIQANKSFRLTEKVINIFKNTPYQDFNEIRR